MDEQHAAWQRLAEVYLRHALGDATAEATIAEVRRVAAAAALESDARVWKLLGLLTASQEGDERRRARRHQARNDVAAVLATVELAESFVREESPEEPLLASAVPAERRELIEALRRAVLAAKGLSMLVEQALDEAPR